MSDTGVKVDILQFVNVSVIFPNFDGIRKLFQKQISKTGYAICNDVV